MDRREPPGPEGPETTNASPFDSLAGLDAAPGRRPETRPETGDSGEAAAFEAFWSSGRGDSPPVRAGRRRRTPAPAGAVSTAMERLLCRFFGLPDSAGRPPPAGPARRAVAPGRAAPRRPAPRATPVRGAVRSRGWIAAAGLVVLLAVALLVVVVRPGDAPSARARHSATTDERPGDGASEVGGTPEARRRLLDRVPAALRDGCRDLPDPAPEVAAAVECGPGDGLATVEYRLYPTAAAVRAHYATVRGDVPEVDRTGDPACAGGLEDERSWALPDRPRGVEGRYRCRVVDGRATIWWTSERALVEGMARRSDGDLAALFTWWLGTAETAGS